MDAGSVVLASVDATGVAAPQASATISATPNPCSIATGSSTCQIMIGTIAPIRDAAVAHDGKKTLALLRQRPQETLTDLLNRLEAAIATAQSTGQRVDEINNPSSHLRYEL